MFGQFGRGEVEGVGGAFAGYGDQVVGWAGLVPAFVRRVGLGELLIGVGLGFQRTSCAKVGHVVGHAGLDGHFALLLREARCGLGWTRCSSVWRDAAVSPADLTWQAVNCHVDG